MSEVKLRYQCRRCKGEFIDKNTYQETDLDKITADRISLKGVAHNCEGVDEGMFYGICDLVGYTKMPIKKEKQL